MVRNALLITLILTACLTTGAQAETIRCPDFGYKPAVREGYWPSGEQGEILQDERKTITYNSAYCTYEKDMELHLTWVSYYDHTVHDYPDCRWNKLFGGDPQKRIEVRKKSRKIGISSNTHLASVHLELSRKEFRESNRQKWMDAAEALLEEYKVRGLPCDQATGEWAEYPGETAPAAQPRSTFQKSPSRTTPAGTSTQPASPDDVDEEIDDILKRLKGQ